MKKENTLIPLDEIHPEIRKVAVAWSENPPTYFHLWDKHKLASDIQTACLIIIKELTKNQK